MIQQGEQPAVQPGPGLGDPPVLVGGTSIPVRFPDRPDEIVVTNPSVPGSKRSYTPAEIEQNGGTVPIPPGTQPGQVVSIYTKGGRRRGFLVLILENN